MKYGTRARKPPGRSVDTVRETARVLGQRTSAAEASGSGPSGAGRPLDPLLRAEMEARFGHDFSRVRVIDDAAADRRAKELGAGAYTVGDDIHVARGVLDGARGTLLVAHELAHVAQRDLHGSPARLAVSERHDAAEQEAEEAAVAVALGGQVEITNAPSAAVSPGLMDWLNGPSVRKAVDAVSDLIPGANLARQAGAEVAYATGLAPGTPSIFDPRTSGPGGAGDGGGFLGALGRMWDAETAGQQRASGLVARGQHALEGLITSGESAITSTATGLAQSTQGIPVVGDLAGAGAAALGQITQGQGGFLRGATTMLGGLGNALVNPIGTMSGVANLAADLPILGLPFLPSLRSLGTGAYDVLSGNAGLAETAGQVLNPLSSMETNRERLGPAIQHFTQPYEKAIGQGRYMEAVGRGVFDLGPFIMGMGGSSAAEGGGSAAGAVHGTNPVMEMPAVSAAEAAAGQMPRDWSAGAVGRARPPGFVGEMPAVQMEQVLAGAEPADFWRRAGRVSPASSAPAPPGPVPGTVIPTPDLPGPVDPFAPTSPGVDPLAPTWREPGPRRGGTVPGLGGHPDTIPGGFSKPNVKMFSPLDAIDRWLRRLREPGPD